MTKKLLKLTALMMAAMLIMQTSALAVTHVETGESIHLAADATRAQLTDYEDYVLDCMQAGTEYRGIEIANHENYHDALPELLSSITEQMQTGEVTESHLVGLEDLFDLPTFEEIVDLPIDRAIPKIVEVLDTWPLFNKESCAFEPQSLTDPEPADTSRVATMRSGYGYTTVEGYKTPFFRFTVELKYGETPRKDQSLHNWRENYTFVYDERNPGAEKEWMLYSIVTYQLAFFQDRPEFIADGINETETFFTIRDDESIQQIFTDPSKVDTSDDEEKLNEDVVVQDEDMSLYNLKADKLTYHYDEGKPKSTSFTLAEQDIGTYTNLFYSLTLRYGIPIRSDEAVSVWQNGSLSIVMDRSTELVVGFTTEEDDNPTGPAEEIELTSEEAGA